MEIFLFIAGFFAEIVRTVAGFGFSTIFLPLALLFYDFKTALVLVALMHIFGNVGRITFFRHGLDKRMLLEFGIPSVLLSFVGALLAAQISQDFFKASLGVFLVGYAWLSFMKGSVKIKASLANSIIGGGLSGFLAGMIGTGGALRGAFLTSFGMPKEKYIATTAAIALVIDVTRIPVYFAEGFLSSKYYWYIPFLFAVAFAGSYVGKQVVKRVPQEKFKKIVLVAIFIVGLLFIYDWLQKFI